MASKVATPNNMRWIWPSIACVSIGAFAWSNISSHNKYELSLQEFQTQITNLREIIASQKHSIHQHQSLISSNKAMSPSLTNSYSSIIKSISPSIVNLVIESESTLNFGFFQVEQPTKQLGTGVIIRSDGIIVTNNHVVTTPDFSDDQIVTVYLSNSRKVHAHIILKDELNDLALLKLDCADDCTLPYIEISDISSIEVGDRVLAIGNNLGLHNTVTDGIISAIGRAQASQIQPQNDTSPMLNDMSNVQISKNPYLPFIQTNAAINQGSSGGALIDSNQRLIGINTAIASPIGVNIGIGFAIPSSYVLSLLRSLDPPFVYNAQIIRPWDGLNVRKQVIDIKYLSQNVIQTFNIHSFYIDGVEVVDMHRNSPAKESGVRTGDVLIMLNNKIHMDSMDKYWMVLNGFTPNQVVNYLVLRWNDNHNEYQLQDFDVEITMPPQPQNDDVKIRDSRNVLNGCLFAELQPSVGIELGINAAKEGVMLMEMPYSSIAAHYGLKAGDILLEIDGVKLENVEQLKHFKINRNKQHNIVIQRGDMVGQITV